MTDKNEWSPHPDYPGIEVMECDEGNEYAHSCENDEDDLGVSSYLRLEDTCWRADDRVPARYCVGCGLRLPDLMGEANGDL